MSLSERQAKILDLARGVWDNQHAHSLDTVDGTFYWRGCRHELTDGLIEQAKREPADAAVRLQALIPGFGKSQGGPMVGEDRIPMRGAVTKVETLTFWPRPGAASSELEKRGVVTAMIRNAEWTGSDVADAIHNAWDNYLGLFPGALGARERELLGLSSPEHLVMDMRPAIDHSERLIDISEVDTFRFEPGETSVHYGYKPTPDWVPEPSIEVQVSAPPPAKPVIATWYDSVAIDTYGWAARLRGARNGQDVVTSIRTWTAALLIAAGRRQRLAFGDVEDLTDKVFPSNATYYENRGLLFKRVPEARPFLDVRSKSSGAPDTP